MIPDFTMCNFISLLENTHSPNDRFHEVNFHQVISLRCLHPIIQSNARNIVAEKGKIFQIFVRIIDDGKRQLKHISTSNIKTAYNMQHISLLTLCNARLPRYINTKSYQIATILSIKIDLS